MKRFITLFILCVLYFTEMHAVFICMYVSDSGHEFYYTKSGNSGYNPTKDEIEFIAAQVVEVVISTQDPNYNKDEMVAQARQAFKDSIRVLYNANKEYMWTHFPEYKYTFDEVFDIVRKFSSTMVTIGLFGDACSVDVGMDIRSMVGSDVVRKRVEQYPYILGYLYKDVKYYDGKKCKLQYISSIYK